MDDALIELKNVSKSYQLESGMSLKVLDQVSFKVQEDEIIALLGPSGSGKSTCLRLMCGLIKPTIGTVYSRGKPLEGTNLDVAFVFQSFALFPWKTVLENINLALQSQKMDKKSRNRRLQQVIDLVGLEGFEEAYPRELSGGMKQRVGIARALVMDRPILLLDEPFSALDVLIAESLREEMIKIFLEKKTSVRSTVIVTHNIQEAVSMAKRIMVMGSNPGFIKKEILNPLPYPRYEDSAQFQQMVSLVHAFITEAFIPDGTAEKPLMKDNRITLEMLPSVQVVEVVGLLEALISYGLQADIFHLAQQLQIEFGKTLYLVKAAEILGLVDTPKQQVILTHTGQVFAKGNINQKKEMLNKLFGNLKIVQLTAEFIKQHKDFRAPINELVEQIKMYLPNENPYEVVETLIAWGRFAEFFGYNDDTKEVYLDTGDVH